jgi:hypothetical protein
MLILVVGALLVAQGVLVPVFLPWVVAGVGRAGVLVLGWGGLALLVGCGSWAAWRKKGTMLILVVAVVVPWVVAGVGRAGVLVLGVWGLALVGYGSWAIWRARQR